MPSFGGDRKLIIMDRFNLRKLKHKGYINHKAFVRDLVSESFYFTPYRDGNGYLAEKDVYEKYVNTSHGMMRN